MIRGLYSAATGMLAQQAVQDALASNLANINTTAFKQDVPTFRALHEMALRRFQGGLSRRGVPVGGLSLGAEVDQVVTDMSAGPLTPTGNPLDLALNGSGFFTVQTPQGERYTRAGQFRLTPGDKAPDGKPTAYLTDANGNRVLGQKGPINLAGATAIVVDAQGSVLADRVVVDKLKLVSAPTAALTKEGNSLFSMQGSVTPAAATVRQGYLEQSNVNAITAMVKMITVQRAYEAAQRAITAQDETLGKAANEMGKV